MRRDLLAPGLNARMSNAWEKLLIAEGVPHLKTDMRTRLPVFWVIGAPGRWLHVAEELTPNTKAWFEAICNATCTDGFLAIGPPHRTSIHLEIAKGAALDEQQRRLAALIRTWSAQ